MRITKILLVGTQLYGAKVYIVIIAYFKIRHTLLINEYAPLDKLWYFNE